MSHLLHIDSSSTPSSVSRQLAERFRQVWQEQNPDGIVTYRDLAAEPVPHLSPAAVAAGFIPAVEHDLDQQAATLVRDELIEELLAADAVLVSTPMYNWTIPSSLKAWIDQVLVSERTITFDGTEGPLAGRPATIVASYGGGYTPGAPMAWADHCGPYLDVVFNTGLGMQTEIITAQLSLAHRSPAMARLIPLAEQSRAAAQEAVERRAREVAAVLV
ncbi:MAG TPA: NAD(P)H-dependent oxidoreductase [Actinocrinis sp.]|uniref:FMN-dependent NADH-azoreductase n=1 Tax=Actinocrinis sp. TaxID=1920516 RepID=UPI002D6566EC|nr:NAD(P)H-dependent oxidoreductase [Actinocrinis sp.]HZU56467.1 NAD(P)H-dependent oxidoreductase [Actinocrinis sp.]